MKLKFRVAPHIKEKYSTGRVMNELTLALLIVYVVALVFYGREYDMSYVTHALLLLVVAEVTSIAVEMIFAKVKKISFKKQFETSFPYITPLILVLIMPINTPLYVMFVATALAVFFGKMIYGGLGYNIFNPAGLGRAIIALGFGGQIVEDLTTSATPIGEINGYGWAVANESVDLLIEPFGGWQGLLTGWHAGSLGETFFVLIIVLGVILIIREVIDWRIPVFYIGTVFLTALVIGLVTGVGLWYPVYHVVTGGVAFAAVFMLTDPVTNPTPPMGRVIFAILAGILTVMLRVNSNMPGGVVFAILFANMLAPAITRILEGNQIKTLKKGYATILVLLVASVGLGALTGANIEAQTISTSPVEEIAITEADGTITYELSAPGFAKATPNVFEITIDTTNDTITDVVSTQYNDTPGPDYGEKVITEDNLAQYEGIVVSGITESNVDAVSGATRTSESLQLVVDYAINHYNTERGE